MFVLPKFYEKSDLSDTRPPRMGPELLLLHIFCHFQKPIIVMNREQYGAALDLQ